MSNIMLDIETLGTRIAHNALDDAIAQARTLQALLDHVKEGEEA